VRPLQILCLIVALKGLAPRPCYPCHFDYFRSTLLRVRSVSGEGR
jgi:hypothetical protein